MPKKQIAILIWIFVFFILITPQLSAKSKIRLKFATLAPKTLGWALQIRNIIVPAIYEATHKSISIKWYWGGLKGDDSDYIELMNKGELDGAALAGHGVMLACPEMAALELPFLFRNYDEVDYVREHMYDRFNQLSKKRGYQLLFWGDQDFDQIYTTHQKIQRLDDFKTITFAGWNQLIEKILIERIGANQIPVKTLNISSSIRQKKANAYIGPALWVVGSQLYTSFRYISTIKIRYSPAALVLTQKAWNKIPSKYHQRIKSILDQKAPVFHEHVRADSNRALIAMEKYGLHIEHMSSENLSEIKKKCFQVWDDCQKRVVSIPILNEIQKHLSVFRKKQQ